ncbi:DNA adenine methylase [Chitinophagaceae bacterium LWZ2-11]
MIIETSFTDSKANPFLRWTGSKRWFVKEYLGNYLPSNFKNYHEPFLGGGAVFFHLKNNIKCDARKYFISDSNEDLINCYLQLRDNLKNVIAYLRQYINSESEYYKIRDSTSKSAAKNAARFIYLNRTSFNGIYRVNSLGKYNVPYGWRENVDVITRTLLKQISVLLDGVNIKSRSFEKSLNKIKENDLVFIDPPYTVAHENNGFIEYNQKLFSWDDQIKLKQYIEKIIEKKAYFILTNASHESIYNLYSDVGNIDKLSRVSQVGGRNKTRGIFNELVVYNTKI